MNGIKLPGAFASAFVGLAAIAAMTAAEASASVPTTSVFEGYLRSSTGGAAPDGNYTVTFRLYEGSSGGQAYWSEGPVTVAVASGQFSHVLGSKTPLDGAKFAAKSGNWLEVQVGSDPAAPRQKLHSSAYALVARDVACSGCVSVKEMKFDGDINMGGYALTATKIVAQQVVGSTITAQKFIGDGSGLTGIKGSGGTGIKASTCSGGKFVIGVDSQGNLKCASSSGTLPSDGLQKISNGTLSNKFTEVLKPSKLPIPIPDHAPTGVKSTIVVPDVGIAEAFSISIDLTSSDISQLSVFLTDPKGTKYTLYNKGGKGPTLLVSFPPAVPLIGNLNAWTGKNIKGPWTLHVVDHVFLNNQTDGKINKWSVNISTLSNKKVLVSGDLHVTGTVHMGKGSITTFGQNTGKCDASKKGVVRHDHKRGPEICTGTDWVVLRGKPIIYEGHCSHTRYYASSWNYYCLNRTYINTAQDYLTISTKSPSSGTSSSSSIRNQWSNDSQIGRITAKIAGYYRITFRVRSRHSSAWWYGEILRNGSQMAYVDYYGYSGWRYPSQHMDKIVYLAKGQYINARARTNSNSSSYYAWYGCGSTNCPYGGLRIEFLGHDWK